ncbi:MAG: 50S ribosomal protein L4 [Candidatus Spechtbacteria bacterium RIFCSPLOWO2_01_FULL_46_10]|uniref:Large ribosomal subunit protein uL4 n=1 Tax=Candidatus Spechtbacteria bacterium RIFCSPLOWO2_01_FULL_46_10 TaxID=1802163 RepID=A0A1G2HGM5_9BACT|nr:MAG: 50S ribosomal protein L4 [Candidatus Spechtbacteria bacterium RIFCSPLOWO2_01_FULL_46_10]
MQLDVYNQKGQKTGQVTVPEGIFSLIRNDALVYQVFTVKQAKAHHTYAHTKTRADVRGGGRKPWKQKGTGRARHGSRRSPLWVGGGITFGPRNVKAAKTVNQKMNKKAIATVLSSQVKSNALFVIDSLNFTEPKTRQGASLLAALGAQGASNLVLGDASDSHFTRVFRNIPKTKATSVRRINIIDLLSRKNCILSSDALKSLINSYPGSEDSIASRSETVKNKGKLLSDKKINKEKISAI